MYTKKQKVLTMSVMYGETTEPNLPMVEHTARPSDRTGVGYSSAVYMQTTENTAELVNRPIMARPIISQVLSYDKSENKTDNVITQKIYRVIYQIFALI